MKENSETNSNEELPGDGPRDDDGDLLDDESPEDESEGVIVSLSRGMGAVARTVSDSLQTVSNALMPRRHSAKDPDPDDLPILLEQLGDLVAAQREAGYASLAEIEDFWRLVARISLFGRRKRLARTPDQGRRRKIKRVLDVEPGPLRKRAARPEAEEADAAEPAGRRGRKKKSADEADEAGQSEE